MRAFRRYGIVHWRVVTQHHQVHVLHAHDAPGFGPAAVVAQAHAHHPTHGAKDRKAQIANLEITLFQMLPGPFRFIRRMAGQMHFAVLADDFGLLVDQDGGVEAPLLVVVIKKHLGITKIKADAQFLGQIEQGLGLRRGHRGLVKGVQLRLVLDMPARKKRRQRHFWINHETGAPAMSMVHHIGHAFDNAGFALLPFDGA